MAVEGTHLFNSFTCQPVCGPGALLPADGAATPPKPACGGTGRGCPTTCPPWRGAVRRRRLPHRLYRQVAPEHRVSGPCAVPSEQRGGYQDWLASNVLEFTSDAYRTRMYDGAGDAVDLPGYRVGRGRRRRHPLRGRPRPRDRPLLPVSSPSSSRTFRTAATTTRPPPATRSATPEPGCRPTWPPSAAPPTSTWPATTAWSGAWTRRWGRLQDALRSLDLLRSTVLLYTTDHGCHSRPATASTSVPATRARYGCPPP